MEPFTIKKKEETISSINRTIRMKPEVFDQLNQLSESSGVSFNKVVNQCIEYALANLNPSNSSK